MFRSTALVALSGLLATVSAQQVGTNTAENHPALTWYKCTTSGGCVSQAGKIVLDANWRWAHTTTGYTNCYTGNAWDSTICPDNVTCAKNCAIDGADYSGTYGITTSGNALTLKFVTNNSNGKNVGARVYLMSDDTHYNIFKVMNQEFTFDVDVSNLPCGLNGAVYFSEMDADGGLSKYPNNKAGAKYGTGYCDSQCPRDLKFINGEANVSGWSGSSANSGAGDYGSCCNEMDIWEANSISTAYTPHPCTPVGQYRCTGADCGNPSRYSGVCDPDGCDFNSYRQGDTGFYGPGKTVDTTKKITVVTQFITDNGTATGKLTEIRRLYVQNGVVIQNSVNKVAGIPAVNSITDAYCDAQKTVFGDQKQFQAKGGLTGMGQSLARGGVLVLSVWDDYAVNMLWLDSQYPTDCTKDGCYRGTCPTTSGVPSEIEVSAASATVTYSNIRVGDIGSTYSGTTTSTTTTKTSTTSTKTSTTSTKTTTSTTIIRDSTTTTSSKTTTATGATQTHYGQCGGQTYTGPTVCASPYTCQYSNPYYSQCL
ncbi:Exoglucanase 1 [Tulasnella sp. 417]|nr:Exoglucanase 1 [Tulasnella sp. 417]